jgi:hypothetical protein
VDGATWTAHRAVLADVAAPLLYRQLLDPAHLPPRLLGDLDKFQWDSSTLKVDWALSAPVPWKNEQVRGAGTVHLGGTLNDLSTFATDLVTGRLSDFPFTIMGQMTTADPTRSPAGTEAAWGYTHLPRFYGGGFGFPLEPAIAPSHRCSQEGDGAGGAGQLLGWSCCGGLLCRQQRTKSWTMGLSSSAGAHATPTWLGLMSVTGR